MHSSLVIVLLTLFTCACVTCQENNQATRQHGDLFDKLIAMEERIMKMEKKSIVQANKIRKQETIINDLQRSVASYQLQESELLKQSEAINELRDRTTELEQICKNNTTSSMKASAIEQANIGTFTSLACESNIMRITCPSDRTINITDAIYGQASQNYGFACPNDCCPPHPNADCFERVEHNAPQDWLALKYLCDAKFECEFQYVGVIIPRCGEGYVADYMQVFFSCSPGDPDSPVGFTTYSTGGNRQYDIPELVIFDSVLSNYGANFNPATSTFICPIDGLYFFVLNIMSGTNMYVVIARDYFDLVLAWTGSETEDYYHGSNLVITDCFAGQTIWIKAIDSGNIYGHTDVRTSFSGYLLYRY